ncbi:hypothetical protein WMF30_14325 [Sorangium sp. So ce134]
MAGVNKKWTGQELAAAGLRSPPIRAPVDLRDRARRGLPTPPRSAALTYPT